MASLLDLIQTSSGPSGAFTAYGGSPSYSQPAAPAATAAPPPATPTFSPQASTSSSSGTGSGTSSGTSGSSGGLGAPLAAPTSPLDYTPKNENVADNINSVIAQNSALMTLARSQGLRAANSRGLLNSSMAVNAGQDAVLKYATPIGSQQAQQNFQHNDGYNKYTYQTDLTNRDLASREKLAQWQLNSTDANNTANQMSNASSLYANQIANINNNTNLSASARATQISQARAEYDRAMRLIEQIYNVDLAWA